MKKLTYFLFLNFLAFAVYPARAQIAGEKPEQKPPLLTLQRGHTLHILSPEPVQYVDIASSRVAGDLPLENVLRIKLKDSLEYRQLEDDLGTITIIGESFIAQYRLSTPFGLTGSGHAALLEIKAEHTRPLESSSGRLTRRQMEELARSLLSRKAARPLRGSKAYGVGLSLNGIRVLDNYIFVDVSFTNHSNLQYDVDALRFFIEDKKIHKATNAQSIEIWPLWQYQPLNGFKKTQRNVFVLEKVTFPDSKVLRMNLTEKQISGRSVDLPIKYSDILKADSF